MNNTIVEVINTLCEKFGVVIDWTSTNVIPQIQELMNKYIHYEIATSIVWIFVSAIIAIIATLLFIKIIDWKNEATSVDDDIAWTMLGAMCGAGVIICLCIIVAQVIDIVTCITFPEKIIFDYISNYLTNH